MTEKLYAHVNTKRKWAAIVLSMFLLSMTTNISAENVTKGAVHSQAEESAWSSIREAMSDSACGFANRAEYRIMDRDFVDAVIQRLLDRHYNGKMPKIASHLAELTEFARTDCTIALRSQEGLRRLALLFQRRFANPSTTFRGDTTVIDYGFVPGTLVADSRARIATTRSPHIVDNQWASLEVAESLARAAHQYSEANCIEIVAYIADTQRTRWTYRYERQFKRVVVYSDLMPTGAYVTEGPVDSDFSDYLNGRKSLGTSHLRWVRNLQVR